MQITDIRIRNVESRNKALAAFASVTIDDAIVIHDIAIICPEDKDPFISMPNKKLANGQHVDTVHPINSETRNALSAAILEAFEGNRP